MRRQPVQHIMSHRPYMLQSVLAALVLIFVLAIAIPACGSYFNTRERTVVVNHHEQVCDSNSNGNHDCQYLVFTDSGTFELSDSIFIGRFNTSDLYGKIKDGHRYHITYYGWRFGCTSSYPNIKTMEEV